MKRLLAVAVVLLAACSTGPKDLVIVSKELRGQAAGNTSLSGEFGSSALPSGNVYWVEGKVQNTGERDYRNVQIGFKCSDGAQKRVLTAVVPLIPAGKTVPFRTRQEQLTMPLKLLDEPPDFWYER
jgi:hypothetical protein